MRARSTLDLSSSILMDNWSIHRLKLVKDYSAWNISKVYFNVLNNPKLCQKSDVFLNFKEMHL